MDDTRPANTLSLDDLATEVMTLRQRLTDLERQMKLLGARPTGPLFEPPRGTSDGLGPGAGPGPAPVGTTPFAQVLTADEDTAKRHLEQLRAAIVRLREERAQAAAEFRNLTRPLEEAGEAPDQRPGRAATETGPAVETPTEPPHAAAPPVAAPPPTVVAVPDDDSALSALPVETQPDEARVTEVANHVRLDVDDVPVLPVPGEAGDEAWREVRQAVLQSDAWRERDEPRRRWMPMALAFAGAAALSLAGYALWPTRSVPAGTSTARAAEATPPAPAPPQQAADRAASPVQEVGLAAAPPQGAPIGTSGTSAPAADVTPGTPPRAPSPEAAPVTAPRIVIQTTREVWMRTTVDDGTPVERLVPGGRTLRFDPAKVLVLRAGDAGGLRVIVDGEDRGVLGTDGQVVTRRYELSPRTAQP